MQLDVLFIRHAHTYGNAKNNIDYSGANDALDSLGLLQIPHLQEKLASHIQSLIEGDAREVVVHRSDTNRTRQTLELTLSELSKSIGVIFTLQEPHDALGEIDMGLLADTPFSKAEFRKLLAATHERFPNGESPKDVGVRMHEYVSQLDPSKLHIICSHGIAIQSGIQEIKRNYNETLPIGPSSVIHLRLRHALDPEITIVHK